MKTYYTVDNPDFIIDDEGDVIVVNALTPEARHWVEGNIEVSGNEPFYPRVVLIEPRFLGPVCRTIDEDGLTVGARK